jgi:spore maturation protein CgeB
MPEDLRGYIDGVVAAQNLIYGYDMVSELFDETKVKQLEMIAPVNLGDGYDIASAEIYRDWIRKEVTVKEREELISDLGLLFPVSVATDSLPEMCSNIANIKNLGYVDYINEMPKIFRESKINLNFTLRTIQSGLPLRLTDVLGAGGFLITNYQPELPYYFENGNSIVWFESREHLLDLCAFYLRNDNSRGKIRENGYNIVRKAFSYERLLGILLSSIKE